MGCFSFKCKECNKPVNSTSFSGEGVKLFLLQNEEVLEEMQGDYDSYGGVLDLPEDETVKFSGDRWTNNWSKIVNLMFNSNKKDGIAAIHTDCWKGNTPTEQSKDDPNQGWGKIKKNPSSETFHKFYKEIV